MKFQALNLDSQAYNSPLTTNPPPPLTTFHSND